MAFTEALNLRRHISIALFTIALFHIASIYTVDSPEPVYYCPLDRRGLSRLWSNENCYWSASYAEAREKFVALGNRLKEQVLLANDDDDDDGGDGFYLDVIDVRSVSYDIARDRDYPEYLRSIRTSGVASPQSVLPEKDTIDALLLTIRTAEGEAKNGKHNVNLIHSSGTHGIEGYVGSAVQIRFLHELFLQNEERIRAPSSSSSSSSSRANGGVRKVLLIHAVNPYGMRHHRRTNENNVDLNRNVLSDEMWSDARKRDPNFVGYVDMDSVLNPFVPVKADGELFSWANSAREGGFEGDATKLHRQDERMKSAFDSEQLLSGTRHISLEEPSGTTNDWLDEKVRIMAVFKEVITFIITRGYSNGKRTMVAAQYHKPSGIFYGGGAHNNGTWENSIFAVQHAIREFASFQFDSPSSRVLFVDVHTGLGKWGDYSILLRDAGGKAAGPVADNAWASKWIALLERKGMGYGASGDASVSAGYDQSIGFLNDRVLCPAPHCFPLTQEFGTRPGIGVAVALILENKGHNSSERKYGHLTSWAFNPQRLSWRRKALRGGMDMLHAALDF